tara:strand:+ start:1217 stop:2239 length:1023 start_codon:yes stop_codon:yes gene_type:complete
MADLLKEAIADAKAVRQTAIANAKLALEEAFTPKLQSMLAAKINEQEDIDFEDEEEEDVALDNGAMDTDLDIDAALDNAEEEEEGEEDLELESIIKELEGDEEEEEDELEEGNTPAVSSGLGGGENKKPNDNSSATKDPEGTGSPINNDKAQEGSDLLEQEDFAALANGEEDEDEDEDETSLEEVLKALREQDDEDEEDENGEENGVAEARYIAHAYENKLREAYGTVAFLKKKINEVNLLNAKLLFSNKLFRAGNLNENQKLRVIDTFDRANNLREVKLVYSTLAESFKGKNTTKRTPARRPITEGFASRPTRSTKPRNVITEGQIQASRFQKLAGLIK